MKRGRRLTSHRLGLRAGGVGLAAAGLILAAGLAIAPASASPAAGDYCYMVNGQNNFSHQLTRVDKLDFNAQTNETTIGPTNTRKTDAIALQPSSGVLYGADSNMSTSVGSIGTLSLSTGAFTALPNPVGTGQGALGAVTMYDFSGLTFDPATGILYASHVRWTSTKNLPDVLLQVNLQTGRFVANAFGTGKDYVVLNPLPTYPDLSDFDDIAIDPTTGQMYGIVNNGVTAGDRLVKIDKRTGAVTDVGPFGIPDVEGLDFDPSGQLWATAGGPTELPDRLLQVNKQTGLASNPRVIDNGINYEALACMTSMPAPVPTPGITPAPTANPALTHHVRLPFITK